MLYFLTESTQHLRRLFLNRQSSIGKYHLITFADGEHGYELGEDVKRRDVALIASILPDPASLFDLLSMHRTLRDNGSLPPTLVIPYLGYARQDRAEKAGEGAIGIMVAELIRNLNAKRIVILDIHSKAILDALGPNVKNINCLPLFAKELSKNCIIDIVVAPDKGAKERAETLASLIEPTPEIVVLEKERPRPNVAVIKPFKGKLKGKNVVIIDDIIDTGGTIIEAVKAIAKKGPKSIHVVATHGIFSKNAREKISKLPIDSIMTSNSLPQSRDSRINVLDITPLLIQNSSE